MFNDLYLAITCIVEGCIARKDKHLSRLVPPAYVVLYDGIKTLIKH